MKTQELKNRTKAFALRVMNLVEALPKSIKGRAIANQLIRSGTNVAADYRAACRARSKAEFISKIGTVEEEADESALWMELIIEDKLLSQRKVGSLLNEADELVAIMAASYISAARAKRNALVRGKSAIRNQQSEIHSL
ncbi:MAG TPA: four helix bundle protein [Pyrinomonadaceae bacterium]|nr:four helix bundle protein [Pyrinomonadaceae bacterium]